MAVLKFAWRAVMTTPVGWRRNEFFAGENFGADEGASLLFAFCFFACEYHSDILTGGRLGLGDICGVASFGLADRDGVGDE